MLHLYQDTPIGGGDALYAMTDVNINNPEDGQMLVYDASTQRWRNVTQKSLNDLAEVTDLTNVIATGSTNATGATIPKGLYFYLNDELCQAKADIANGATFTLNTNYEEVTAGGLNSLNSAIANVFDAELLGQTTSTTDINISGDNTKYKAFFVGLSVGTHYNETTIASGFFPRSVFTTMPSIQTRTVAGNPLSLYTAVASYVNSTSIKLRTNDSGLCAFIYGIL